jgi:hypothetical protein
MVPNHARGKLRLASCFQSMRMILLSSLTQQEQQFNTEMFTSVLRIHDILVWIRIRGSMLLTNGSESFFFVIDLQDVNIKLILKKCSA